MDKRSFLLLVDKVAGGTASEEELALYNHYYNHLQSAGEGWDEEKLGHRDEIAALMLERIDGALGFGTTPARTVVFYKKTWVRAAAVLLVTLAGGWLIKRNDQPRLSPQPGVNTNIVSGPRPGSNQATLTLANGSRIVLSDTRNGLIAKEGNTQVMKLDDGRLTYTAADGSVHGHVQGEQNTVTSNILSTPYGGKYQATLPDGTLVWLNSGSTLKFPTAFTGSERKVELTGEAYFEVARDQAKPFKVFVRDMEVDVLGTHFNVMGYEDEGAIKASLLTGSVRVTNGKHAMMLTPGQQVWLNNNGHLSAVEHADMDEVMAWKNGLFDFEAADIMSVMRQLARWYDVEVSYQGHIDQHFTGKIERSANIVEVLKMLELTEKVHFSIEGRKIIVSR